MDKRYFSRVYEYDSVVNKQLLEQIQGMADFPRRGQKILAHILAAEKIWLMRIKGRCANISIWPDLTLELCQDLLKENQKSYATYFLEEGSADLSQSVSYRNSKGVLFSTPVSDILMHVLIHSGYHRGQIARIIGRAGGTPVNTDYITYVRN